MPRLAHAGIPILVAAAFTAGCASADETPQSPPSIVTQISDDPTPTTTPTPPTPDAPAPPETSSPPAADPAYPDEPEPYAKAVVAAWADKDLALLATLTSAEVHEQLIEIPGPFNMDWTLQMCDGTAGSSYCRFRNEPGDVLTLRISHTKLGSAHAAVEVRLDAIA